MDGFDFGGREFGAGRIAGRHQHHRPSARRDQFLNEIESQSLGVLGIERQINGLDALHLQPHVVIEIVRYRQNDFVAWTRQRRNGNAVCLIAPRGDGDVLGAYAGFIIGAEMPGESNAQLEGARNVAVKRSGWLNRNRGHVTRQSFGRLVAGNGLGNVQQLLVGGKCTPAYPPFDSEHPECAA